MSEGDRWQPTIDELGLRHTRDLVRQGDNNRYAIEIPSLAGEDDAGEPFQFEISSTAPGKNATLRVYRTDPESGLVSGITFAPFVTGRLIKATGWIETSKGEEVLRMPVVLEDDTLRCVSTGIKRDSQLSPTQTALIKATIENPYNHTETYRNWTEFPIAVLDQAQEAKRQALEAKAKRDQLSEDKNPPYENGVSVYTDVINNIWQKTKREKRKGSDEDRVKGIYAHLRQWSAEREDEEDDEVSPIRMFHINYTYHPLDKVGDFSIATKTKRVNAQVFDRDTVSITYMFLEDEVVVKIEGLKTKIVLPFEKIIRRLRPEIDLPGDLTYDDIVPELNLLKEIVHNPEGHLIILDDLMDRAVEMLRIKIRS